MFTIDIHAALGGVNGATVTMPGPCAVLRHARKPVTNRGAAPVRPGVVAAHGAGR
jgi:hypothetical protein